MKCIDRIKPEVLEKIKKYGETYPNLAEEIIKELHTNNTWTRLTYFTGMEIQDIAGGMYLGDCFYTIEETEKLTKKIYNYEI